MDRTLNLFARRYFAGTDFPHMIKRVKALNENGFPVILDLLGEKGNASGSKESRLTKTRFVGSVIETEGLNASIALRPGQFENDFEMTRMIVKELAKREIFVWIDMEKGESIDGTIKTYKDVVVDYSGRVGLAVQAYWKRTMRDLDQLVSFAEFYQVDVHIRPVRGVYVDEADYKELAMMHYKLREMIDWLARVSPYMKQHVGSHHPDQIARAICWNQKKPGSVDSIQLLLGVYKRMPSFLQTLTNMPIEIYVPFGPSTAAYLKRRLQEAGGAVKGLLMARLNEGKNFDRISTELCHLEQQG
jgi:proline dehydrogenase